MTKSYISPSAHPRSFAARCMIVIAASFYSLAAQRVARRQAKRLIRAKRYINDRGLLPYPIGSAFGERQCL